MAEGKKEYKQATRTWERDKKAGFGGKDGDSPLVCHGKRDILGRGQRAEKPGVESREKVWLEPLGSSATDVG